MKKPIPKKPRARRDDLIIQELPGETLVYDTKSHKAHCLNTTSARIWDRCNGARTVTEISQFVTKQSGEPVDESVVWLALKQLEKSDLMHTAMVPPASTGTLTRREVMKRIGISAAALPVITSILAPTTAAAASCAGGDELCCDQRVTPRIFFGCCPGLNCRRLQPQDVVCVCKPGSNNNCDITTCLGTPLQGTRPRGRSGN